MSTGQQTTTKSGGRRWVNAAAAIMIVIGLANTVFGAVTVAFPKWATNIGTDYTINLRNLFEGIVFLILTVVFLVRRSFEAAVAAALLIVGHGLYDFFADKPGPDYWKIFLPAMLVRLLMAAVILRGGWDIRKR